MATTNKRNKDMNTPTYTSDNIQVLEGLEAVRQRPSMYIGNVGEGGLHHLVYEVVDNSMDEALAGYCDKVVITIYKDNSISVLDNGRGIPTEIHKETGLSAIEVVLTKLHAGGKFNNDSYKTSGGLHGVGISVVNALSKYTKVCVFKGKEQYSQEYEKGLPISRVVKALRNKKEFNEIKTGTYVYFKPDDTIFDTTVYNVETLADRFKELSLLNPKVHITLRDERTGVEKEFYSDNGLIDFFTDYNKSLKSDEKPIIDVIRATTELDEVYIDFTMQYNTTYKKEGHSFVNNIRTIEGGTHVTGFRSALLRVFKYFVGELKMHLNFNSDDIQEGLVYIISLRMKDPQFEGQTKTKLGNSYIKPLVDKVVYDNLLEYFEFHPEQLKLVFNKIKVSAKSREAASKARDLARAKLKVIEVDSVGVLPGKLADCQSNDPSECEIYFVEGESAGGSAKQARDRRFQAILPLRGKVLNVEGMNLRRVLQNEEIKNIITALGTGIGENFNQNKLRYHKIVIMTDADVDGAHIRSLLLTLIFRQMPELIMDGFVYIAQPPLYKVESGKSHWYVKDAQELPDLLRTLKKDKDQVRIQRYKGLGEMAPQQLWETTMDPVNRTMLKVKIEDAIGTDHLFSVLMGDDVEPRRNFIYQHALSDEVKFEALDI
jgi:DNA gyrase subunit B